MPIVSYFEREGNVSITAMAKFHFYFISLVYDRGMRCVEFFKKQIEKQAKKIAICVAIVLASAGYFSWYVWRWEHRLEVFEVYFFDLKKGNAVFVRTPHGKTLLFGGGESNEIVKKLTEVMPVYRRRVDEIFLWGNEKNAIGVVDVLSRYDVGSVVMPSLFSASSSSVSAAPFTIVENTARERGVEVEPSGAGSKLDDVFVSILDSASSTVMNAIRISYGHTYFLLIGDTTKKEQAEILAESKVGSNEIRAQVLFLKSATASRVDLSFFNDVNPRYVIVPKLPTRPKEELSKKAFNLYAKKDVRVFSLEKEGAAVFTSDGNRVEE